MGGTKAVAVEMERSQSGDVFWSLNDEDLMMGVGAERKGKTTTSRFLMWAVVWLVVPFMTQRKLGDGEEKSEGKKHTFVFIYVKTEMEMSRRHLNVKWGIITADINLGIFTVKVVLNTRECMRSFTGSLLCSALKKQLNAYLGLAPSVSWAGSHLRVMFWDSLAQVPQFFPYGTLSMKSSIHALIIFLRLKKSGYWRFHGEPLKPHIS